MLVRIYYETFKGVRDYVVDLQYIPSIGTTLEINPKSEYGSLRVVVQHVTYKVDESEFIKTVRSARGVIDGTYSSPPQIELFAIHEQIFEKRRTFLSKLKAILNLEL